MMTFVLTGSSLRFVTPDGKWPIILQFEVVTLLSCQPQSLICDEQLVNESHSE